MTPSRRTRLDGPEAALLTIVAFASLWTVGAWLVRRLGVPGMGVVELVVVLAPAVLWCLVRRVDVRAALLLRRPAAPVATLAGALLAGAGAFYLTAALVEWAMERTLPLPPALKAQMRELIVPASGLRPFALDWTVLALAPALCEEALFRGALLGAFGAFVPNRPHIPAPSGAANQSQDAASSESASSESASSESASSEAASSESASSESASSPMQPPIVLGRAAAVVATALLFGFYHGSVWKVIPTAALGLVLGTAAVRARSLVAPVVVHLVNNTLVLVLVRAGIEDPPPPTTALGALAVAAAAAALTAGLSLLRPAPRR